MHFSSDLMFLTVKGEGIKCLQVSLLNPIRKAKPRPPFWFPSWNLIPGKISIAVYGERRVISNPVWIVTMIHTYTVMSVSFEDNFASQESRSYL